MMWNFDKHTAALIDIAVGLGCLGIGALIYFSGLFDFFNNPLKAFLISGLMPATLVAVFSRFAVGTPAFAAFLQLLGLEISGRYTFDYFTTTLDPGTAFTYVIVIGATSMLSSIIITKSDLNPFARWAAVFIWIAIFFFDPYTTIKGISLQQHKEVVARTQQQSVLAESEVDRIKQNIRAYEDRKLKIMEDQTISEYDREKRVNLYNSAINKAQQDLEQAQNKADKKFDSYASKKGEQSLHEMNKNADEDFANYFKDMGFFGFWAAVVQVWSPTLLMLLPGLLLGYVISKE